MVLSSLISTPVFLVLLVCGGEGSVICLCARQEAIWLGYAPCDQVPAHRPQRISNVLLYHPPSYSLGPGLSLNLGFAFSARQIARSPSDLLSLTSEHSGYRCTRAFTAFTGVLRI